MKKVLMLILAGLFLAAPLYAEDIDGRTSLGTMARIGHVMKRGVVNALTTPAEFLRTPRLEKLIHPKAWPITMFPRTFTNTAIRMTSAGHDIFVFPLYLPFTNDISPWTEAFDLPEYAFQK